MLTALWPAAMVNAIEPLAVVPVQLVPVYQVTVPALPEEAVKVAPVVTPLLLPSSSATVMTLAARAQAPAVKVRGEERMTSLDAAPAATVSVWVPVAILLEAMVTVGPPASVSS